MKPKIEAETHPANPDANGQPRKISALAPWYGSKRNLAPHIVDQLGDHRVYWEPFCGSCAVLFAKPRCSYETVNDLHRDLINVALVVQQEKTALDLYGRMSRCLFHEDMLPIARAVLTTEPPEPGKPDVERAYWYLVFSWMGLNGISGLKLPKKGTFAVRYSATGGNGATRWTSVCESIPEWHRRLVGVQILCRDGFELLERIDDADGTTIYVDPPYLTEGAGWVHDFERQDHDRLATLLRRFRSSRVVVSYYDHPALADLYPNWARIDGSRLGTTKSMANSSKSRQRGRTEAPEILLTNGPALGMRSASIFS